MNLRENFRSDAESIIGATSRLQKTFTRGQDMSDLMLSVKRENSDLSASKRVHEQLHRLGITEYEGESRDFFTGGDGGD